MHVSTRQFFTRKSGDVLFAYMNAVLCTTLETPISFHLMFSFFAADQQERHNDKEVFSISPIQGILEAHEANLPTKVTLKISFTARYSKNRSFMVQGVIKTKINCYPSVCLCQTAAQFYCVSMLSTRVREENKNGFALLSLRTNFSAKIIRPYIAELLRNIQSIEAHLHMGMHFNMAVLCRSCMCLDKQGLDILIPICPNIPTDCAQCKCPNKGACFFMQTPGNNVLETLPGIYH